MKLSNICDQNWAKFPSLFLRHGAHKVSGMHGLTDGHTRIQNGFGTVLTVAESQKAGRLCSQNSCTQYSVYIFLLCMLYRAYCSRSK